MLPAQRARRALLLLLRIVVYGGPVFVLAAHRTDLNGWLFGLLGEAAVAAFEGFVGGMLSTYFSAFFLALFIVPLGFMIRALGSRRFRQQAFEVFRRTRAHLAGHPATTRSLAAGVGLATAALVGGFAQSRTFATATTVAFAAAMLLGAWGVAAATRAFVRNLVAPSEPVGQGTTELDAEGMFFSAVAVTPEARAMVGAFAGVSVAVVALLLVAPRSVPKLDELVFTLYPPAAVAAALLFRGASRVALGVDGVLIKGTSRTRFFAYRDLDDVDLATSGDVVLRKAGRGVLRLQLHGDDAARTAAIVTRLRASIARAAETADDGAQRLAERSPAVLAEAARGDGNYRSPGATREALWEIVESVASNAAARAAAARALAEKPTARDRRRLRIAAEQCVDPAARAELLRIAPADFEAEDEAIAEAEQSLPARQVFRAAKT